MNELFNDAQGLVNIKLEKPLECYQPLAWSTGKFHKHLLSSMLPKGEELGLLLGGPLGKGGLLPGGGRH